MVFWSRSPETDTSTASSRASPTTMLNSGGDTDRSLPSGRPAVAAGPKPLPTRTPSQSRQITPGGGRGRNGGAPDDDPCHTPVGVLNMTNQIIFEPGWAHAARTRDNRRPDHRRLAG